MLFYRVWRHFDTGGADITNIEVIDFSNSRLTFNFLSPDPSSVMPSRCIVPYYEMPRYLTTQTAVCPARAGFAYVGGPISAEAKSYQSTTISLNQIPDK